MTNQEWIDMMKVIPEVDQNTMVIVLQNGCEINVDTFVRFEPNFIVMRGRVGGQTEDGRGFFVPYDQMLYFRIERLTNIAELREIMAEVASETWEAFRRDLFRERMADKTTGAAAPSRARIGAAARPRPLPPVRMAPPPALR